MKLSAAETGILVTIVNFVHLLEEKNALQFPV